MEGGGDSILDSIFDEEKFEDVDDVEMLDVEDGELVEENVTSVGQSSGGDTTIVSQECQNKSRKRKNKKKQKRKKGSNSGLNVTDINRFVLDVCKRLKERKSFLIWTAVGCLGVSAFSDLVKEVDAIQACGGQKTADGKRYRTGGGILWGILKLRDPNAYKEIMKKGNEFEKQLKQSGKNKTVPTAGKPLVSTDQSTRCLNASELVSNIQDQPEQPSTEHKRPSVHDRIRVPVAYDDLVGLDGSKDEST
ncbi:Phosphorylated adapter RNA export protein [Heracleum sosnowskyi]|uniref:Phosphorylated adapter RNA export protein n=1 Tax=Heracleum sosnowskyi TaxID=360622 RepID=A0AAD8MZZ8_9APIA|nr:Phosphorylated adapter RNA export protein [Heracleum sosnowskyi]